MMALEMPQNQNPIAKPYENPQELPSECAEQGYNQGPRATNMEKFREIVIKLANSAPNKPLSDSRNSRIHDQFNRFFSVLHTPDHPPYAWMIQRALQELNEKGGSSEESISDFMRKENYDLPWSHLTLLKHHLQALCECGDIILTHDQHYLLAGADSTVESDKRCRRKSSRRKRAWDWKVKRRKQRKKDIDKESLLQKKDQVREMQNCMLEGPKQQNLEAEARNDTPSLYIVGENREQIQGDQTEISTPDRPPESAALEAACHRPVCCERSPFKATDPTIRPSDVVVSAAEGFSGHQEQIHVSAVYEQLNHEEDQIISSVQATPETGVSQTLQEGQPMTTINGIDLRQTNTEELPAMPSQARPVELCIQKKPSESELATNTAAAISETEPVNLTGAQRVTCIVFKYKKRPPANKAAKRKDVSSTIEEIKDEVPQQKQLKCEGERHLNDNTTASSLLQQQLQEHGLSNTNEQQEVKSGAANRSKYQGCLRPRPPKSEQSNALNTAKSSQSHHQHDVQQQQKKKRRGRPPKAKSDNGVTNNNVVSFPNPHQMQQPKKPKHKHQGRPPERKPGASTVTNEKLLSGTQRHKLRNLGRSRRRKAVEGE